MYFKKFYKKSKFLIDFLISNDFCHDFWASVQDLQRCCTPQNTYVQNVHRRNTWLTLLLTVLLSHLPVQH